MNTKCWWQMSRKNKANPRIKIHPDGRATLAGLDYRDLRSILTAASLWRYREAEEREHNGKKGCNCLERLDWSKSMQLLISMASASMDMAIRGAFQPHEGSPSKEQRLATVREARRFRLVMAKIFADMDCERKAKPSKKKSNATRSLARLAHRAMEDRVGLLGLRAAWR